MREDSDGRRSYSDMATIGPSATLNTKSGSPSPSHLRAFLRFVLSRLFSPPRPTKRRPSAVPAANKPEEAIAVDITKGGERLAPPSKSANGALARSSVRPKTLRMRKGRTNFYRRKNAPLYPIIMDELLVETATHEFPGAIGDEFHATTDLRGIKG